MGLAVAAAMPTGRPPTRAPKQQSAELHQAGLGRRRRRFRGDAEPPGRPPHQYRPDRPPPAARARASAGSASSRCRKLASIRPESGIASGSANPPAARWRRGSSSSASCRGLGHHPVPDLGVQRPAAPPAAPGHRPPAQPLDHQLRQPRQLVARDASREDQADRLGFQAAGHEPKDLGGGLIRHLLIVDQADPAGARPRRPAGRGWLARPGSGPARTRNRGRRSATRPARSWQALEAVRHNWCTPAKASSISDWTPATRTTRQPVACSARYSSSAVLPTPGPPRTTRVWPRLHAPRPTAGPARRIRGAGPAAARSRSRDGRRLSGPPLRRLHHAAAWLAARLQLPAITIEPR